MFGAEYCLTHAITHHPPESDSPCSAVSLRQLSYLSCLRTAGVGVAVAHHGKLQPALLCHLNISAASTMIVNSFAASRP